MPGEMHGLVRRNYPHYGLHLVAPSQNVRAVRMVIQRAKGTGARSSPLVGLGSGWSTCMYLGSPASILKTLRRGSY